MPNTNNVMSFADPEVDPILEANRNARSYQDVKETSYKIEQIIHDRALWIPGYQRPFYRIGYWRWLCWPEDFNVKIASEAEVAHVHWIDDDIKAETLEAMKTGRSFGEKELMFDQYKVRRTRKAATDEDQTVVPPTEGNAVSEEIVNEEPASDAEPQPTPEGASDE